MPPKKSRDNRRQRREEREQRRLSAAQPQGQPSPSSSSSSSAPAAAAAAEGPPAIEDADTLQFFLSTLMEALQRRGVPSSAAADLIATLLSTVLVSQPSPSSSPAAVSGAVDTLLSSLLVAFRLPSNPSRTAAAASSTSASRPGASSASAFLDGTGSAEDNAGVGLTAVDDQETSSGGGSRGNVRCPIDDTVSEPSTSGRAATAAAAASRSRTPQQSHRKPNGISDKKLRKELFSKLRRALEAPKTPKEQQEEVASLVDLCLRHVDHQAGSGPAPADLEDDREGSDGA